jgi:peptide/nickel transport system substrate-binding protein
MLRAPRIASLGFVALLLAACTAPPASRPSEETAMTGAAQPAAAKRITAAVAGTPTVLFWTLAHNAGLGTAGVGPIDDMINGRLAAFDGQGALVPRLAETVPTAENGLWRVSPDGRMETTWRIREGARWHDGVPLTPDDLLFSAHVIQDKELAVFADLRYEAVDGLRADDARTFTVTWKRPHIQAAEIFTYAPMPRHLLEQAYLSNKAGFTDLRYWSEEMVGAGPYRLQEFVPGSHLVLRANDSYALGRPKLDEITVRLLTDGNSLVAAVLSGAVDVTLGQTLSVDQANLLENQWRDGTVLYVVKRWWEMHPQHYQPSPPIVASVPFRQALLHGLERETIAETIGYGSSVAHSLVSPESADYAGVADGIVRYEYDPRRAAQLLEGLGYSRGAAGIYQDAAGQRLSLEVRTSPGDTNEQTMLAVVANWQRLGIAAEPFLISAAQNRDQPFRASFPAFNVRSHPTGLRYIREFFHSAEARTPENSYLGSNGSRYRHPEMDALVDSYFATIPEAARTDYARRAVRHATEQVVTMGLFYGRLPTMVSHRLLHVGPGGERAEQTWDITLWDLRGRPGS